MAILPKIDTVKHFKELPFYNNLLKNQKLNA